MPEGQTLVATWLLGVSMGLTACTATCLPFMGTWMLAREGDRGVLWLDTSGFIGGRIAAYTGLGLLAALAGRSLEVFLTQGLGQILIGGTSIAAGFWLLAEGHTHRPCALRKNGRTQTIQIQGKHKQPWHASAPPFLIGASLSLTPCAPLASLLVVCAHAGAGLTGALQGLAFGLGSALTPLIVILPALGKVGHRLREQSPWLIRILRWTAATILLLLGIRRILLGVGL